MHAAEQHALEEHRSARRNKRTQRIVNDAAEQNLLYNRPCQHHRQKIQHRLGSGQCSGFHLIALQHFCGPGNQVDCNGCPKCGCQTCPKSQNIQRKFCRFIQAAELPQSLLPPPCHNPQDKQDKNVGNQKNLRLVSIHDFQHACIDLLKGHFLLKQVSRFPKHKAKSRECLGQKQQQHANKDEKKRVLLGSIHMETSVSYSMLLL